MSREADRTGLPGACNACTLRREKRDTRIAIQADVHRNAAVGDAAVQRIPAVALAAKLPRICAPARDSKAESRTDSSAIEASRPRGLAETP
jgi:hypothetical protein